MGILTYNGDAKNKDQTIETLGKPWETLGKAWETLGKLGNPRETIETLGKDDQSISRGKVGLAFGEVSKAQGSPFAP